MFFKLILLFIYLSFMRETEYEFNVYEFGLLQFGLLQLNFMSLITFIFI